MMVKKIIFDPGAVLDKVNIIILLLETVSHREVSSTLQRQSFFYTTVDTPHHPTSLFLPPQVISSSDPEDDCYLYKVYAV